MLLNPPPNPLPISMPPPPLSSPPPPPQKKGEKKEKNMARRGRVHLPTKTIGCFFFVFFVPTRRARCRANHSSSQPDEEWDLNMRALCGRKDQVGAWWVGRGGGCGRVSETPDSSTTVALFSAGRQMQRSPLPLCHLIFP